MKTKYIVLIICGALLLLLILLILLVILLPKDKKIENITHLRFTYTTGYHMNASVSYEINLIDDKYIATIKPTDLPEASSKEWG